MRRFWVACLVALAVVLSGLGQTASSRVEASVGQGVDVPGLIDEASAVWGVSAVQMRRISWCESRWFPGAVNRRSGAAGLFQMIPTTWRATPQGRAGMSPLDPVANTHAAMWLMVTYGPRQWACK